MSPKKTHEKIITLLCIVALILVIVPLLILGHYDYPSYDDWTFGLLTRQAVLDGKGLFGVLKAAFETISYYGSGWEPRYAALFLGALQPGIWGEHFYRITPYLIILSLIFSECLFGSLLLCNGHRENYKWLCPILFPSLIIQLLYVPYPTESIYWYVGAINYSFMFCLSLILFYIFFRLSNTQFSKKGLVFFEIIGILAAALIGGNNYSTSLSTVCLFCFCSILFLFRNKKAFWRTLPLTLTVTIGLLLCIISPGNQVRLNTSFNGHTNGIFQSIWMSLTRTCANIYSWTNLKIIIMLLMIFPFLWQALKKLSFQFKMPVLFTLFSFCIYASQITANMYVEGGISACRISDILYYGYHVWLLLNVGYWTGWLQRQSLFKNTKLKSHLLTWFCTAGFLLLLSAAVTDIKTTTTFKACSWLLKGTASDYAAVWEDRLTVLHDDSIKNVEFEPIPGATDMIFYADFDPNNPWFSEICAKYYHKDSIGIK